MRLRIAENVLLWFALALLGVGCAERDANVPAGGPTEDESAAAADFTHDDASQDNAAATDSAAADAKLGSNAADPSNPDHQPFIAFAKQFETSVNAKDLAGMNAAIDWRSMCDKSEAGLKLDAPFKKGFENGFLSGKATEKLLTDAIGGGGQFKLLRTTVKNGKARAVFRLLSDQGVNYYDALLRRDEQGQVRIVDIYIYTTGQSLTSTMRWSIVQSSASAGSTFSFTRQENTFLKNAPKVLEMNTAYANGDSKKVLEIYHQLPAEMQHSVTALILRAAAAQNVSPAEYQSAFEDFCKYHPNNAAIDLLSLDYHLNQKNFAEMRQSIDRIDKRTGGDPNLNVLRASSYLMEDKPDEAASFAQRAIDEEPSLADAYWARISVALRQQDFAAVRIGLLGVEQNASVRVADLTTGPVYADFVASPEYDKWLAERKAPAQAAANPTAESGEPAAEIAPPDSPQK